MESTTRFRGCIASANTPQHLQAGMSSLLSSSFIKPDLPCNICGAWIQGAFAVLDVTLAQEPQYPGTDAYAKVP
ncbi:hypothetical protein L249_4544 [Ophiocordyceps polyrhachis-furcata BCC 54312]|uniref:Uncharacterized protein n=1 Tax=Ophiocordyceps polyrhachis-furcata BCC 54312 TaxID=1330021 RepID=A0A367KZ55_9HYPO|nr:hypothetical protein L249_4544 [Ophiocordyceps polyrhachis-furcata BCC 54312]